MCGQYMVYFWRICECICICICTDSDTLHGDTMMVYFGSICLFLFLLHLFYHLTNCVKCHLAVCSNDRVISFFNVHVDCRMYNVECTWCMFIVKIHLNVEFLVEVDVNKRIHILKWTLGRLCVNSGRIHQHD